MWRKNRRSKEDEQQFLDLIQDVLVKGTLRKNRTGVAAYSLFVHTSRWDLREKKMAGLTTKMVNYYFVIAEFLWMMSGSTDSKVLSKQGVGIWDLNGSREALDARGLTEYKVGDLGPIYGFQWRHAGATYVDCNTNYREPIWQGVDQIQRVIDKIKKTPTDRDIVLNAWNSSDLPKMALPPCHVLAQFYVNVEEKGLSCHLYQRSGDVGLGVPYNLASYSILVHVIAFLTGMQAKELIYTLGDAHIYETHVEQLKTQWSRIPRPPPHLRLVNTEDVATIDDFKIQHFQICNYNPYPALPMKMVL